MRDVEGIETSSASSEPPSADLIAAIYDLHGRELFTFAQRARGDDDAAEALVHEAFLRLIAEIEAERTPGHIRAWLYRVVANLIVSRDRDGGPASAGIGRQPHDALVVALGELDYDARTALLLAANGFNGMEIAEAIGRSGHATRTLLARTRIQLRHRLVSIEAPA